MEEVTKKWAIRIKTFLRQNVSPGASIAQLLIEEWKHQYEDKENVKTVLESVDILKYLELSYSTGTTEFFRLRMRTQMSLCCLDDTYEKDMENWQVMIAEDFDQGIAPSELDGWRIVFLDFHPRMFRRSSEIYNSGLPLDPNIPVTHYFQLTRKPDKFRIGFLGGAWFCHTTTYLMRGLIRSLDPDKFEVFVLVGNYKSDGDDVCREDLRKITNMINLPDLDSSTEIGLEAIRKLDLDFLVDAVGPGPGSRGSIFPYRPAKVQLHWMAHPGTCGNKGLQYLVVDPVIAPVDESDDWFTEKRAYMDQTYFNGDHRDQFKHLHNVLRTRTTNGNLVVIHGACRIPICFLDTEYADEFWAFIEEDELRKKNIRGYKIWNGMKLPEKVNSGYADLEDFVVTTRRQFNLDEKALVLCSFNSHAKHNMETVDLWIKILQHIPNAVLWVSSYPAAAKTGLENRMVFKGLDKNRLIMEHATFSNKELYLRKLCLVDLALDPLSCNGHTCSYDAIFLGCPVLCLMGNSLQSRVTASFNRVLQVPCLITESKDEYFNRAVWLGTHPSVLVELRKYISLRKKLSPVFDPKQFAAGFEILLERMFEEFTMHPNNPEKWAELGTLIDPKEWMTDESLDEAWMRALVEAESFLSPPQPRRLDSPVQMEISPVQSPGAPPPPVPNRRQLEFTRITSCFYAPTSAILEEYYIGQRISNFVWIETAVGFCLEAHLKAYFTYMFIGPIQAAQFAARFYLYLKQGLPKFPASPDHVWNGFFTSCDGVLHKNAEQYFLTRSLVGNDGKMKEPSKCRKLLADMTATDRKSTENCLLCDLDSKARQIATLRDVHGPDYHTWLGRPSKPRDCVQCNHCGVPLTCLLSNFDETEHMANHAKNCFIDLCECSRLGDDMEGIQETHLTYHPFKIDLTAPIQDSTYLEFEIRRYCDLIQQNQIPGLTAHDSWCYHSGQKMLTFLWLREGLENVVSWMRENIDKIASSGHVIHQFLALFQVNLNTLGCPIMPNITMMDADARKDFGKSNFQYSSVESYNLLLQLFDDAGDFDEMNWTKATSIPSNLCFCKICQEDLPVRFKDVRKTLTAHHLLPTNTEKCGNCGFKYNARLQDVNAVRITHDQLHSEQPGWKESITDAQDPHAPPTRQEYDISL